jgi:hypothetical protein
LRFWSIDELNAVKILSFKFHCKHPPDDSLSAAAVTKDNNFIITGDTSG